MIPSKSSDVKAAEQTVMDFSDGRLFGEIAEELGPLQRRPDGDRDPRGATGPTLDGTSPMGDFHVEGELGPPR